MENSEVIAIADTCDSSQQALSAIKLRVYASYSRNPAKVMTIEAHREKGGSCDDDCGYYRSRISIA